MCLLLEDIIPIQNPGWVLSVLGLAFSIMTSTTVCAQSFSQKNQETITVAAKGSLGQKMPNEFNRIDCSMDLKDRRISTAYQDACHVLLEENSCSKFFVHPNAAVIALRALVQHMQQKPFNERFIGMRMFGRYNLIYDHKWNVTYRLFEKTVLNLDGPFFSQKSFPAQPDVPNIGQFRPNSREARVTILLHEVGHLVRGNDGGWLLQNDAGDISKSSENTDLIIKHCREQINHLAP
jgi:hypothetical protein